MDKTHGLNFDQNCILNSMKQKIVHFFCHYLVLDAKCGSTRSIARACSPWRGRPSARNRTFHRNRWNRNL